MSKSQIIIKPKNQKQKLLMELLKRDIEEVKVLFLDGPAGVGKTYCTVNDSILKLRDGYVDQIVITRPCVASEDLGYLPGKMEQKLAPYLEPIMDCFESIVPGMLDNWIVQKKVVIKPIAYMQGKTFNNAIVIIDEYQNITIENFKMLITRIGENTRFIFDGDRDSIFLKSKKLSCANPEFISAFLDHEDKGIYHFQFTELDSVRSKICREILKIIKECNL